MTSRRSWAALLTVCSGLMLAAASASEAPRLSPRPPDAGPPRLTRDAGVPLRALSSDGGFLAVPLSPEDLEVLLNLELLEHLPESDVLELLLPPQRDE